MPIRHFYGDVYHHVLQCLKDKSHDTYAPKYTGTIRIGLGTEVYVSTGQPVSELAPIADQATSLANVNQAKQLGHFPGQQSPEQLALLAQVALAYRLDPLMGEIIPYQGKPYITIAGRRRLDNHAGNKASISFRILTPEETDYYKSVGALADKDVACFCVLTSSGNTVEGFGRILASETKGDAHLPQVSRTIEMSQKRAERRAREIMFGPVPKPKGLNDILVLEEGDEVTVIDGTSHVVADAPPVSPQAQTNPLLQYGECPIHPGSVFETKENQYGGVYVSHPVGDGEYCRLGDILREKFGRLWAENHDGTKETKVLNNWLKEHYGGNTWSKMPPEQWYEAVAVQEIMATLDTSTGEILDFGDDDLTQEQIDAEYVAAQQGQEARE